SLLTLTLYILTVKVLVCAQRDLNSASVKDDDENGLLQLEELIVQLLKIKDEITPNVEYGEQGNDRIEYDNEWAVEIIGGEKEARKVARSFGYTYVGPVRGFENTYVFHKDGHRHKRAAEQLTRTLRSSHRVR
ncbi:Neuroendocrine convertase 1, partial [Toxocara canis]